MAAFIIIFPFIIAFADMFDNAVINRIHNYFLLASIFLLVVSHKRGVDKWILSIYTLLLSIYIINYLFGYYSNTSYLINTFAFLFFSLLVSHVFLNCDHAFIIRLDRHVKGFVLCVSFLLLLMLFWGVLFIPGYFNLIEDRNLIIGQFNNHFGLYKQTFGYLLTFILLWNFVYWRSESFWVKSFFIVFLVTVSPLLLGIRTAVLGLSLLFLLVSIKNKSLLFILLLTLTLLLGIFIADYYYLDYDYVYDLISFYYDRLPSVKFGFDQLNSFGVGNGGYHLYVTKFGQTLFDKYASGLMLKNGGFWISPESDLAYFMASFGFLSIVFFILYIYFIKYGLDAIAFYKVHETRIFVLILLFSINLILDGVSEDYAGRATWWFFLSASFGLIRRSMLENRCLDLTSKS